MNKALFGLHALNLVEVGLKGLALFLDISGNFLVVLLGHLFSFNDHLLLHVENLLNILFVNSSLADLVLDHGDDNLDLVDLLVERVGFPGDLTELLQEFDTFHLGVVDQVHVLHLLGDELFLELGCVLVGGVYLTKIFVVLILELARNQGDLTMLGLEFLLLGRSDLVLEIEVFPLIVNAYL
jgi:hypothetical protein